MSFLRLFPVLLALALAASPAASRADPDGPSAAIFTYHRIGDDNDPSNSIRVDQFLDHVRELRKGGYHVLSLPQIVDALRTDTPLPDRTVAISFDGGDRSILEIAAPVLLENGFPFTIFIAASQADGDQPDHLNWQEIRRLARNKLVTLGLHSASYTHLADDPEPEIRRQVNTAKARFRKETGEEPSLFAYPFGEYSLAMREVIRRSGFRAAFGQQSGVAYAGSDLFALPRFSMTEPYGDLDRFRMTAEALPFPVSGVQPADPRLSSGDALIGFTVDPSLKKRLSSLSCFVSDQEAPLVEIVGENRVEIRPRHTFDAGRVRVNCTLPVASAAPDEPVRWRWFGLLMTAPGTIPDIATAPDPLPAGG